MKRRRAEESADGLALMTSSVTSSQSADGLSPVVARYQQQMLFALRSSSRKIPAGSICVIPAGQPDASNSSIQSRASVLLHIQSTWNPRRKKRRSSKAWQTDAIYPVVVMNQQ
ncbi:transcriptional regulator SUPERMAN-like [Dorcoceras hygrometricum]|uniref:Transcriptional regulator SUPERMAN-like n=1 Tax=Dorcoceras hygrometricum TaxID=472368 RepID=A0A2Z7ACI1_9LAMI|nr:transcriptional regulator SUPERMAN-like [Dorcoceras hygrometricum]